MENPERKLAERISGKNAAVSRYPGGEYSISARIKLANCKVIFYNKNNMCLGSVNGTEEEQMPENPRNKRSPLGDDE